MGLVPALGWLVERLNKEDGIDTKILVWGEKRKLKPEADVMIFRIVQEALNNVRRHSKASAVRVAVEFAQESLRIAVHDNGRGFSLPKTMRDFTARGKLGLIGMQQRAEFLDGLFQIRSNPSKGTSVTIEIKA